MPNGTPRIATGIAGLDEILNGGLLPGRTYLVSGGPGAGKTTVGFHFLSAGLAAGEACLFITFGQSEDSLKADARSSGFDLDAVTILDLAPSADSITDEPTYDVFAPAQVERAPVFRRITEQVESQHPQRIFIDSLTQLHYLASDSHQYRRLALSLLQYLVRQGATVLLTSEGSPELPDDDLQFLCDGVIQLHSGEDRYLTVTKFRGSGYRSGNHAMRLTGQGVVVYPRLLPGSATAPLSFEAIGSGVPDLDELLHGGLERGTVTIITGPSGVGKTTVGMQFAKEAAGRGERTTIYLFEEAKETLLRRATAIHIPARQMVERGTLQIVTVEPLQFSADEFAFRVRQDIEQRQTRIVMIDSSAGYRLSVRGEDVVGHLHAICKYLRNMGVTVLLTNEVEMISGDFRVTEMGISYLADNILYLRYLEHVSDAGITEMRKIIGVLKKRVSDFEKTVRELQITPYGLKITPVLGEVRGTISAAPRSAEPGNGQVLPVRPERGAEGLPHAA